MGRSRCQQLTGNRGTVNPAQWRGTESSSSNPMYTSTLRVIEQAVGVDHHSNKRAQRCRTIMLPKVSSYTTFETTQAIDRQQKQKDKCTCYDTTPYAFLPDCINLEDPFLISFSETSQGRPMVSKVRPRTPQNSKTETKGSVKNLSSTLQPPA